VSHLWSPARCDELLALHVRARMAAWVSRLGRPGGYIRRNERETGSSRWAPGLVTTEMWQFTAGTVRGRTHLDPILEIELKIQADGFASGVAAMILASCQVQGAIGSADLGQAETIITQLGFPPREGGDNQHATREFACWHLTRAGVERLEHLRNGENLVFSITPEVVLLNYGESLPGLYPRPQGVHRPNSSPHSPIRHAGQEQFDIPAESWARQVLSPWQQAAAVTLVVELPEATTTDDHRTVVRDLTDARQRLDAGDWKGSIRASRDAVEVLRSMHAEHLNLKKTQRDIDEREAAILDAERHLIQSLFDYGSATHPDPALRAIAWTRENAMLSLTTAAAVAQRLFSAAITG
jgi:hypothetical protein